MNFLHSGLRDGCLPQHNSFPYLDKLDEPTTTSDLQFCLPFIDQEKSLLSYQEAVKSVFDGWSVSMQRLSATIAVTPKGRIINCCTVDHRTVFMLIMETQVSKLTWSYASNNGKDKDLDSFLACLVMSSSGVGKTKFCCYTPQHIADLDSNDNFRKACHFSN